MEVRGNNGRGGGTAVEMHRGSSPQTSTDGEGIVEMAMAKSVDFAISNDWT